MTQSWCTHIKNNRHGLKQLHSSLKLIFILFPIKDTVYNIKPCLRSWQTSKPLNNRDTRKDNVLHFNLLNKCQSLRLSCISPYLEACYLWKCHNALCEDYCNMCSTVLISSIKHTYQVNFVWGYHDYSTVSAVPVWADLLLRKTSIGYMLKKIPKVR